jgi:hypothetical protein
MLLQLQIKSGNSLKKCFKYLPALARDQNISSLTRMRLAGSGSTEFAEVLAPPTHVLATELAEVLPLPRPASDKRQLKKLRSCGLNLMLVRCVSGCAGAIPFNENDQMQSGVLDIRGIGLRDRGRLGQFLTDFFQTSGDL